MTEGTWPQRRRHEEQIRRCEVSAAIYVEGRDEYIEWNESRRPLIRDVLHSAFPFTVMPAQTKARLGENQFPVMGLRRASRF